MALVDLTKQLAQQAILSATSGPEKKEAPAAPVDHTASIIFGEIQAMQRALKEDEELVVLFQSGVERIRVMELFLRSPQVVVLSGQDAQRNLTRIIAPVASLQLLCKTMKVAEGAKPVRVSLVTPKPKDSTAK
ncbi:MAG TPA: hypothetical protein VG456_21880 [Candidatus Sulfopaludibacter sp.]|jgi:hypothetical protein|nr:hypothetical protein [Candidatus Sulfopaludibacter sp.]